MTTAIPESLVISWVQHVSTPPLHLAQAVNRYRILAFYRDMAEQPEPIDIIMDQLYDHLVLKAGSYQFWKERVPYQEQCNRAIAQWRNRRAA